MVLILSMALPLEKARTWFNIVAAAFGFLTAFSIFGMVYYLAASTLWPQEKRYSTGDKEWYPTGERHFSYLVLAGAIMLSVYLVPIVMRPLDFLSNMGGYLVGLLSYILLIPVFINVFSIYAFSNLHDVSWGNRPTTTGTGTEAFSADRATQLATEHQYQVFRANVLFIWLCANGAFFFIVLGLSSGGDPTLVNDGAFGPLQGFTLFLAGIVVYKVVFAALYVCKWKYRYNFDKKFQVHEFSLDRAFHMLRDKQGADEDGAHSTDDEEVYKAARRIFNEHEEEIMGGRGLGDYVSERDRLDMTLDHLHVGQV